MKRLTNWIEIPVTNMDRGRKFYQEIFGGIVFHELGMAGCLNAIFPTEDRFNTGALVLGKQYQPSASGILVYLDGGKDLSLILDRVVRAGGVMLMPKTNLGDKAGYVGMFLDSEGNRIGLQHM